MPTRTQQSDLMLCAYASHGDTRHILLFPANPNECFHMAVTAFDLADRFQTPVIMMSDLDIGMNDWVVPRLTWDDKYRPHRGRVLTKKDLDNGPKFYRYHNEDENFVTPRTLPGVSTKGSFFIRGSGHNKFGGYTETPDDYQEVMDRLKKKHAASANFIPAPEIIRRDGSKFGVICIGGTEPAVKEGLDLLDRQGIPADFMRIKGFPFGQPVEDFLALHDTCYIVEQSRDAQLRSLLILETSVSKDKLRSVLIYGGFPLSAHHVVKGILDQI